MIDTANMLTGALTQALETMGFVWALPVKEDIPMLETTLCTEISFAGAQCGRVQILVSQGFAETLAENLGARARVTEADCSDALRELANVTCGFLTAVIASSLSDVFTHSVPNIKTNDDVPTRDTWAMDTEACLLNVEGRMVAAKLTLNDQGRTMNSIDCVGIRNDWQPPDPAEIAVPSDICHMLDDYVRSTQLQLDDLEQAVLRLEAGHDQEQNTAEIHRILHKIKDQSGMVGLDDIAALVHEVESAFAERGEAQRPDMLFRFKDWASTAMEHMRAGN